MTTAIAILLALLTAAAIAIAVLLYLAVTAPTAPDEDAPGSFHQPGQPFDQFSSEKGITR